MDRIEALLEKAAEKLDKIATMGYLHDERLARVEALHEENEQRWKEWREYESGEWRRIREETAVREKHLDERIEKLVSAIGQLIHQSRE